MVGSAVLWYGSWIESNEVKSIREFSGACAGMQQQQRCVLQEVEGDEGVWRARFKVVFEWEEKMTHCTTERERERAAECEQQTESQIRTCDYSDILNIMWVSLGSKKMYTKTMLVFYINILGKCLFLP